MKTKNSLLIIVFVLVVFQSYSQTPIAAINTESHLSASSINNVMNTGIDYVMYGQDNVILMVYDGDSPYIHWDINSGTTGHSTYIQETIIDPDVVLSTDLEYGLVVYEHDGSIYLSLWEFNGSNSYSEIQGTISGYTFPYYIEDGTTPNIDMDFDNNIAISWLDPNDNIRSIVGNYSTGPAFYFSSSVTIDVTGRSPDVCIYQDTVTFTYIWENQSSEYWVYFQESATNIDNNNIVSSRQYLYQSATPPYTYYRFPRIAAPFDNSYLFSGSEFYVAVDYRYVDNSYYEWYIHSYVYDNNLPGSLIFNNPDYYQVPNNAPAVTYVGDENVISWTIWCPYPPSAVNPSFNVIARYTNFYTGYWTSQNAPMVNLNSDNAQVKVSVAGRRVNNNSVAYLWVDAEQGDMAYRTANVGTYQMRQSEPDHIENKETIEANRNDLFIKQKLLMLDIFSSQPFYYYISDLTGKILMQSQNINESPYHINIGHLAKGIYVINCATANDTKSYKFTR